MDTNVLSNAMYYIILEDKGKLHKVEKRLLEELEDSFRTIEIILSMNIDPIGINIVRKELKRRKDYASLYDHIFPKEVRLSYS